MKVGTRTHSFLSVPFSYFYDMNRNLRDTLGMLSKATPSRLANLISVVASYYLARLTGKPVHWGLPVALSIEPTTSCNLRCPECPSGLRSFTRPIGMLDPASLETLLKEIGPSLWYMNFYFQGEPYLHPEFTHLVQLANSHGVYTATSTNAHYLNPENARKTVESGLDRLIISIDGTTQEVYEQYRIGGQLTKVLDGTRTIVEWKRKLKSSTPHIIFQFLVVAPNEHQMQDVHKLATELGVDEVAFKTAQVYDFENGNPLIPKDGRYARYQQGEDGKWSIRNRLLNHCWKLWHSCVITWDGTVVPCCFDKDAEHPMGNVKDQNFRAVWESNAYTAFRQTVLRSRSEIEMCKNCTEGTKVWG